MENEDKKANQKPNSDEEKTSQNQDGEKTSDKSNDTKTEDGVEYIHPNRLEHHKKKQKELEEKIKKYESKFGSLEESNKESDSSEKKEKKSDIISQVKEMKALQDYSEDELETLEKFKNAGGYQSYYDASKDEDFKTLIEAKRNKKESNKSPKPTTGDMSQKNISNLDSDEFNNLSKAQQEKYFKEIGLYD